MYWQVVGREALTDFLISANSVRQRLAARRDTLEAETAALQIQADAVATMHTDYLRTWEAEHRKAVTQVGFNCRRSPSSPLSPCACRAIFVSSQCEDKHVSGYDGRDEGAGRVVTRTLREAIGVLCLQWVIVK